MAKLLCMEVGTSTVRLAEVVKRGKVVEITKTFVFDTPDDATKDGKVRVSDSVVSAIRDGIAESGIKAEDVYFVVESTKILFKQVELPLVKKRMIQNALDLAFTDIFPVDETMYHISYVLEKTYEKNGRKMMCLDVFAIPNDLSESYYSLAVELGLNAKGLSNTSRSMISLFPSAFKNRNVAMVNINENVSNLTISVDGDMVFNKTIPHGVGGTIQQVINSPLTLDDIDVTGAAELLYSQNVLMKQMPTGISDSSNEEEKLRYNVTTSIMSLVKAIELTFSAFLTKENIQIQEFHLSGLGAGFAGISQLLTYEFGIPVTVVQQEGSLRINPAVADETLLLSCYPCVGAVLDNANFFTAAEKAGGEIAHKKRVDRLFIFAGVLICLAAFAYGSYSWLQADLEYQDAYDENVRLTKRIQELRDLGVEAAYNDYITALSYNEEVLNLYNKTKSGNEDMTTFLAELERVLPISARVSAMTLTPSNATVSFRCEDKFVAAGVLHLLRNMQTINNMSCTGVAEVEKTSEITFTCTFSLKPTDARVVEDEADNVDQEIDNSEQNSGEESELVEHQLLAAITTVNTAVDLSTFTIGETTIDIRDLFVENLADSGFNRDETPFSISNEAIAISGYTYTNLNGVELAISVNNSEGVDAIGINTDVAIFYNGIHVGMTMEDVLMAIGDPDIVENNGYIIIKNDTNTLILQSDIDDLVITNVYLVNNNMFAAMNDMNADDQNETVEEGVS
jgi:Tfp pilus assembly PilM family ATPase